MKRFFSLTVFISGSIFLARVGLSQNSVGIGTSDPNENAVLELVSTNNDQGFLVPKVTTAQRTSGDFTGKLTSLDNGLLVYDSDENAFYYWHDTQWELLNTGGLTAGVGMPFSSSVIL